MSIIFSYLDLCDLLICHLVSRRWRFAALSNPYLYAFIDLSVARNPVNLWHVQSILQNAQGRVRELVIRLPEITFSKSCFYSLGGESSNPLEYRFDTDEHLKPLLRNLEKLTLRHRYPNMSSESLFWIPWTHTQCLRFLNFRGHFSATNIARICALVSTIEILVCECTLEEDHGYDSLVELSRSVSTLLVCTSNDAVSDNLNNLLKWFPNVRHFEYVNSRKVSRITLHWQNLEFLSIYEAKYLREINIRSDRLTSLSLRNACDLEMINTPVQSNLRKLRIDFGGPAHVFLPIALLPLNTRRLESMIRMAVNVVHLEVSNTYDFNNSSLNLVRSLVFLERLSIIGCPSVTETGIMDLVQSLCPRNGGRLVKVSMRRTCSISSETIEKAKKLGVRISRYSRGPH